GLLLRSVNSIGAGAKVDMKSASLPTGTVTDKSINRVNDECAGMVIGPKIGVAVTIGLGPLYVPVEEKSIVPVGNSELMEGVLVRNVAAGIPLALMVFKKSVGFSR